MHGLQCASRLMLGVSFTLLTACATLPASKEANNAQINWQTREQQLSGLTHWQAAGAIAIQQQQKANSASLLWTQAGQDNYTLALQGPLGAGAMKITGQPGKVTLVDSNNKTSSAPTAEALLKAQTGWYLPIGNLYYWAKGLPVPGVAATPTYDKYHHLSQLQQQGWTVSYERYTGVGKYDLPSKMILEKSPFRVKLVFSQWNVQ